MSGGYRDGWDEEQDREGWRPGAGGYPRQGGQRGHQQQEYGGQDYTEPGGDPRYDRAYQQDRYGTGPRAARQRTMPPGGDPARGGGHPAQPASGPFRGDPPRSGPDQVRRGSGPYPRGGRDPRDSGEYRMPGAGRPGQAPYRERPGRMDHDDFVPGFDDPASQPGYRRARRDGRGDTGGIINDDRMDAFFGSDEPAPPRRAPRETRDPRDDAFADLEERPRKRKRGPIRRLAPWVALVVILTPLIGGGWYAYRYVQGKEHPADYAGAGTGPAVMVEVKTGDTPTSLAPTLLNDQVIKSTRAFVLAAEHASGKAGLEAGFFSMNRHMQASLAYAYLLDPKNRIKGTVTIPEGLRLADILRRLVQGHPQITMADYQKALKNPAQLGLPAYAAGKPEGYLFPSTYEIQPNDTALTVLKAMVARYDQHVADLNLPKVAPTVGMTPAKIIIAASLIQAEAGRNQDMGKIAEVLYHRLNIGMPLKFDSAVLYGLGKYGTVASTADISKPGPYNTYLNKGLPPGPIVSPGDAAIAAALHPEHGNLLYFRGCSNGVTLFSETEVPPVSACANAR